MGGSVRVKADEWVEWISVIRPVRVSRDGLLLCLVPFSQGSMRFYPGVIVGGTLRFNRIGRTGR